MTNKKFKIINNGVVLEFYKAFNDDGKLKRNLFNWYCSTFENTRCEVYKSLSLLKVFYRDEENKIQGTARHFTGGDNGIELYIYTSGDLISKAEKFIGSEYACNFDGLTDIIYNEFFKTESRTPIQDIENSIRIKSIVDYGKISTKYQIDSILTEWQDPVKTGLPIVGGAEK